ncbi:MAG: hypothetical protein HFJ17_03430 [Clostridia bacterium]|nr:hypothetical protein [Clostridia bacterium]
MDKIKKVKFKVIIAILIILIIAILISLYIAEKNFRGWIDANILKKDITEENIVTIDLNIDKTNQVYVYSKYIALLNNQMLTLYNNYGEKVTNFNININNAIFNASDKYLAIAEDGGNEICLILDKTYLWSNKIEGEIIQLHTNKNGYVAVVTKDMTYKSMLTLYSPDGVALFTSYFSSTRIVDVSISNDNKYIAIGELDSSGAVIQSNVKIISVEKSKSDAENAIIYTYNAESGKLLTKLKYQSKGQVVCMYDNSIDVIKNEQNKQILDISDKQINFMAIDLDNHITYIEEESKGIFKTDSYIKIQNSNNDSMHIYNFEEVSKELYAKNNVIAVNAGTEIYFLNTNGWLIRKYSTRQEITNVIFSKNIAAIVYKDKIVIIDL